MIHVAPLLRDGVERVSQVPWAFDALRWILEGGYRQHRQLLSRHFRRPPSRVLDCGCGTGIYADCFAAGTYVGVDKCPAYVGRARARHPDYEFLVMDATRLALADNSFDAVIVCGVIHHLDKATSQRMLAEIARVLQPGGSLLLWEDVPTRDRLNLVGHAVHQLDVGDHIRPEPEYAELLSPYFEIEATERLRSGFMDYTAFKARKPHCRITREFPPILPATSASQAPLPTGGWLTGRSV